MGILIYFKDVVTLELVRENCVGCGMCLTVCPHSVFALENSHARVANRNACMECGACARNCPSGAIRVQSGVGCAQAIINGMLGGKCECC